MSGTPDNPNAPANDPLRPPDNQRASIRFLSLIVVVFFAMTVFALWGDELSLKKLAANELWFHQFQQQHPWLTYVLAFTAYVSVTGLSLPGAAALTLVIAWLLGFWPALLVVSLGSTCGATVAFLLSRHLLRESITLRFGGRLKLFNQSLQQDGAWYLFTLRLIPAVPFFVINAVMGLTSISVFTFWWVSQLGMLPGTVLYVYAGSRVPGLQILAERGVYAIFTSRQVTQLILAFCLFGFFPHIARFLVRRLSGSTSTEESRNAAA